MRVTVGLGCIAALSIIGYAHGALIALLALCVLAIAVVGICLFAVSAESSETDDWGV